MATKKRTTKKSKRKTSQKTGRKRVVFRPSTRAGKKMMAVFTRANGSTKTVHFGQAGASDFTKHKDVERKKRYETRHRARENWNSPETAGALSKWILWNKPTRAASIASFKRRFGYA